MGGGTATGGMTGGMGGMSGGTGGMATGSGGSQSGTGGSSSDGGTDAPGTPTTIAGCGTLATPQAIANCIINLPTDSVGQTVTFTSSVDYTTCKM
jgi:hypothetical protein